MSKEMIISVNGREKKIAIVENGQVTEFYIERGDEENSGVVGNIYKGRVQRVLPGMQSAFVGIGLERDAFLYVSDFFDEEEEFERIMVEKSKKAPPEVAARDAAEQIKKARLEREQQIEEIQEIVEPLVIETAAPDEEEEELEFEPIEDLPPPAEEKPKGRREETEDAGARGGKRGRGRRGRETERVDARGETPKFEETKAEEAPEMRPSEPVTFFESSEAESEPLFEIEASGFERVIDDEETTGEMFKDAYMQEAIVDKVRAVEFDMESTATAEVGSLLDSVSDMGSGFQRIADEDEPVAEPVTQETQAGKSKRGGRGGKKTRKDEQQRTAAEPSVTEAAGEETSAEAGTSAAETGDETTSAEDSKKGRGGRSKKDNRKSKEQKAEGKDKSARGRKSGKNKNETETPADAQASLSEPAADIAEMAVRRGGRRRGGSGSNGGNRNNRPQQARSGPTEDRYEDSKMNETVSAESEFAGAEMIENGGGNSGSGGYQQGGRRETRRERERNQPTITDLLREGQEILVQIAKEPIARKGARITSHIALPGRFLVYMPTIEHVGVSRKIESASERSRLQNSDSKYPQRRRRAVGRLYRPHRRSRRARSESARRRAVSGAHVARHQENGGKIEIARAGASGFGYYSAPFARPAFRRFHGDSRRLRRRISADRRVRQPHPAENGQSRQALHARRTDSGSLRRAGRNRQGV